MSPTNLKVILQATLRKAKKGLVRTVEKWEPTAPFEIFIELYDPDTGDKKKQHIFGGSLELKEHQTSYGPNEQFIQHFYAMSQKDADIIKSELLSFAVQLRSTGWEANHLIDKIQKLSSNMWQVTVYMPGSGLRVNPGAYSVTVVNVSLAKP
jgi:hypothetical protein